MTIKELNKLIKEELDAFMQEDEGDDSMDMGDDIEVTTDEPEGEEDPLDLLRQIFDMLKPLVEPEGEMGDEGDMEDMESGEEEEAEDEAEDEGEKEDDDVDDIDENLDHPNYRADYIKDVTYNAEKIKGGLNESKQLRSRFKKLANIIK